MASITFGFEFDCVDRLDRWRHTFERDTAAEADDEHAFGVWSSDDGQRRQPLLRVLYRRAAFGGVWTPRADRWSSRNNSRRRSSIMTVDERPTP